MTVCNRCGGQMLPDTTAIVAALGCVDCRRLIPMTGVKHPKLDRRGEKRALRAARRMKMRQA